MEGASFAMMATPTPKRWIHEAPTKKEILSQTLTARPRSARQRLRRCTRTVFHPETAYQEWTGEEGGSYLPTLGAKQSLPIRRCVRKSKDGDPDLERSLSELVSDVDKTDDGSEPQSRKSRSEYTPSRCSIHAKAENHQNHKPRQTTFPLQRR